MSSQARLSAGVIAVAPIGFAAVAGILDGRSLEFLLGTGPGRAVLAAGLALDAAGWAWMDRLTRAGDAWGEP